MENSMQPSKPRRAATDLTTGRVNQKARTYRALIEAAVTLLRAGQDFSVADVADAARVGRTTAYTYFPTREALFAQAVSEYVVRADYANLGGILKESSDVTTRALAVVEASDASIALHEEQYRALLRVSLQPDQEEERPPRPAYRQKRLRDALAPVHDEMDPCALERLVAALSLCIGIEAQISLRDICGLSPEEARDVKRWAARAMIQAALAEMKQGEEGGETQGNEPLPPDAEHVVEADGAPHIILQSVERDAAVAAVVVAGEPILGRRELSAAEGAAEKGIVGHAAGVAEAGIEHLLRAVGGANLGVGELHSCLAILELQHREECIELGVARRADFETETLTGFRQHSIRIPSPVGLFK
jgi:AcrR family transcriptional regulator